MRSVTARRASVRATSRSKVNVGVHWGATLMVGQVATRGRLEVTALGDQMNEAARIEAAAKGGAILASKDLIERLDAADAEAAGVDPEGVAYTPLGELDGVSDKAIRDAGAIAVAQILRDRDTGPRLPAHVVALHHAEALGELEAAGQRAGERPERLRVVAAEERGCRGVRARPPAKRSARAVRRSDPDEVRRRTRPAATSRGAPSTQTVRSLPGGASWTPVDEVPGHGLAVRRRADAGGPVPRGVARVVAGGVVDQPARVDRSASAAERRRAPRARTGLLARPDVLRAVAADDLDRLPGGLDARGRSPMSPRAPAPRRRRAPRRRARRRVRSRSSPRRRGPSTAQNACGMPPMRTAPAHSISSARTRRRSASA